MTKEFIMLEQIVNNFKKFVKVETKEVPFNDDLLQIIASVNEFHSGCTVKRKDLLELNATFICYVTRELAVGLARECECKPEVFLNESEI